MYHALKNPRYQNPRLYPFLTKLFRVAILIAAIYYYERTKHIAYVASLGGSYETSLIPIAHRFGIDWIYLF